MSKNITPVTLSNSLNIVRGGLTKAVFSRVNTLVKKFNNVYIYTFLYQQEHKKVIAELHEKGLLDTKVKVLNLFEDIKPNERKDIKKESENSNVKEKTLIEFKDEKQTKPSYRYYNKKGLYVLYKRFDNDGNLLFIDYMDDSRQRTKREEFNKNGFLVRIRHMDKDINKSRLDRYFDNMGECYLTIWINPKTGEEGRVLLHSPTPKEYESIKELREEWVENKIKKIKSPVLMTDQRNDLECLSLKIKHKNLKRLAVIHSTHLKKPYDITAEVRDSNGANYRFLFENINSFNGIIFLTNEQKKDVEQLYGDNSTFFVIPHPAKQVNLGKEEEFIGVYNPFLAVALSRYEKEKRIDESIRAFKLVVDKIPAAEYHIYGFGKNYEKLNQLITELKLENNVSLNGFTTEPYSIYKSAACSILTSEFEGFGMSLTESLASGTPVVSYNTKYGPVDIIRDDIDGYLIENGNRKELAEKIIAIMENKDLREKLSINAYEVEKRFSIEKYTNKWINLLLNI